MTSRAKSNFVDVNFVENLIRSICHDIGAPARHVIQFSELLNESQISSKLEDKHLRWLSLMQDSGARIQTILRSLGKIARLSAIHVEADELNLNEILENLLSVCRQQFHEKNMDIDISVHGQWPQISGCEEHWKLLFSCLLDNACKFQKKEQKQVKLVISCKYENPRLSFTLEDNGIGASESQWKDITRPFKKLNPANDYPGEGIGLTYCDYIAQLNNGELKFSTSSLGGLQVCYCQEVKTRVLSPVVN